MCGRFSLKTDLAELTEAFEGFVFPAELTARYNVAPSQAVAVVANNGQNKVFSWLGHVPPPNDAGRIQRRMGHRTG